ncbi:MAG: guanylate kinase [Spirochaetota bacterium]
MKILKNNFSVVVSAPSGAGKTTIINKLLSEDPGYEFVISTTTRPPRKGEKDGINYYFTTIEDFRNKIKTNKFIEWSLVHQNYYGIAKKEFDRIIALGKIPLFDIDVQGALKLKKILKDAVYIFIIPPSIEILKTRLMKRNTDSKQQINIRIQNALKELKKIKHYDYIIVNENIKDSVLDFKAILRAEFCKNNKNYINAEYTQI